jgi:hypothetical protein
LVQIEHIRVRFVMTTRAYDFPVNIQNFNIWGLMVRAFDSDSINSEISEISEFFWYQNIGIDSAQYRYFRYFRILTFYLPHMEYEGSIGLVMRKMKIFFR